MAVAKRKTQAQKPRAGKRKTQPETLGVDGLTDKQRIFIHEYLICWNASEAARRAGYSQKTAQEIGSENLSKPMIRQAIDARLKTMHMGADEVLARLSDMATADMADFLSADGMTIDLKAARKAGKLFLVKKFTNGKQGISIELHDAKDTLIQLGKYHRLFIERVKLESWQDELVKLLKDGAITPEEVSKELGDDAVPIIAAAGLHADQRGALDLEGQSAPSANPAEPHSAV